MSETNQQLTPSRHIVSVKLSGSMPSTAAYGVIQFLKGNKLARAIVAILVVASIIFACLGFIGIKILPGQPLFITFVFVGVGLLWLATVSSSNFKVHFRFGLYAFSTLAVIYLRQRLAIWENVKTKFCSEINLT